jgi:hypothetical protein
MATVVGQEVETNKNKKETFPFVVTVTSKEGKVLFKTKPVLYQSPERAERDIIRTYDRLGVSLPQGAEVTAVEVGQDGKPLSNGVKVIKGGGKPQE